MKGEGPQTSPHPGGRIFLSYRREDAGGYAGRLYDALSSKFGPENVFIDVDTIQAGRDFVDAIDEAVASSAILIALIGRQWATAMDQQGRRRLENPEDFVRLEIKTALDRGVLIIPVLVGGAVAPSSTELPKDLAPLARRHAHELSDTRWRYDVDKLIEVLDRHLQEERHRRATRQERTPVPTEESEPEPPVETRPGSALESTLSADKQFGPYTLGRQLGRGGMGIVYLATHARLRRKVALKVLSPELRDDPEFRTRFERESMLAASLEHPNIVPIYDAGEIEGLLYIAMRLVDGRDLGEVLRQERALSPERTLAIVSQAADALDYAHGEGLIHRDVKPANIMLTQAPRRSGDHVFLTDFGLARQQQPDTRLTRTGFFVGTLAYTPPEQFRGEEVDRRSDVYSLGCVVFECLTGSIPFVRPSDPAMMFAHLTEPPPAASQLRPDLPTGIDEVIARAMAKDPADRYERATQITQELREALSTAVVAPSEPARVPGPAPTGGSPSDDADRGVAIALWRQAGPSPPQEDAVADEAHTKRAKEAPTTARQEPGSIPAPRPPRRRRLRLRVGVGVLLLVGLFAAIAIVIVGGRPDPDVIVKIVSDPTVGRPRVVAAERTRVPSGSVEVGVSNESGTRVVPVLVCEGSCPVASVQFGFVAPASSRTRQIRLPPGLYVLDIHFGNNRRVRTSFRIEVYAIQ